jgi:hypothetical protein
MEGLKGFMGRMAAYAPYFTGATPVHEAIPVIRSTWEKVSIDDGFGGSFISHFGNKQWV